MRCVGGRRWGTVCIVAGVVAAAWCGRSGASRPSSEEARRVLDWVGGEGGSVHRHVRVEEVPEQEGGGGARLVATGRIDVGETLLAVPSKLILWVGAPEVRQSAGEFVERLRAFAADEGEREEERLAARVALERRAGTASPWAKYLEEAWAKRKVNALQFEDGELDMLRGTYALEEVRTLRKRGEGFVRRLGAEDSEWREEMIWALSVVVARGAVVFPRVLNGTDLLSPLHGRVLLVPGIDVLRHKSGRKGAQWAISKDGGGDEGGGWVFRVIAGEGVVRSGVEVWHEYVAAGNAVLLARYGFAERGNELDAIPLALSWPSRALEEVGVQDALRQMPERRGRFSAAFVAKTRRALLDMLGLKRGGDDGAGGVVVVVRAHGSVHPRGHKATDVGAGKESVAALFNTARIASLSASELSPDGLRRLHTLNHGGESEGARVQESAEKVLLTGVAEGDDFTDRLQSPWGGNSGKGAVEHVVVPRRAELQAMQSLWTALQRLRQSYPTSTSADAALLTQKPSSSARARAGNSRRHASSSSRDASSDPSNAPASLTPLERSIVETRLGEMRLLDAVLQAIRSNTRQLLGSADAVAALLDGTARDDL